MANSHEAHENTHPQNLSPPGISVVPATPSRRGPIFPGDSVREARSGGDLEKSGSTSERAPSPFTQNRTEADKTQNEIDVVLRMVCARYFEKTSGQS